MIEKKKKQNIRIIFMFFLLIISSINFLSNFVSADVISLNSGGGDEYAVTVDRYIEGFFFGEEIACVPDTCLSLGYECGTWDDGCGGTLNCGTCASGYSCSAGTCVADTTPGEGEITPPINILVEPTTFNINMLTSTNVERTISITNIGTSVATVSISQQNLDNLVIFSQTSLTIAVGEKVELNVIFVAPSQPDTYTGKILIDGVEILVALNVKTERLLFDSNIVVLNPNYKVTQGDQLRTMVNIIPMGDPARLDVTLHFTIKDYGNKIYLTKSETLLVEKQMDFKRNFDTGALPASKYVIALELVYPGGVAPSSAHFEVVEKPPISIIGKIIIFLIILILIILIIIIILLIIKKLKEKNKERESVSETS
ncbi:hypothetical protein FJZ20_00380 [Candidatus Pacearchaeota archaeon]|nr:hypothetical protein [Candidatus Pacearchaeota archaeon]